MTSTDPFPKGGIDYHHEQDTHFNSTSDQVSNDPKVNNKNNLGTESSEEHARRPRQNSRIPISNLLCPEEPPKPHSEDRTLPEPETLPPIRPRHQYAYDGWDLPTKPSSSSSTSVPVPPESHHYKFGQPYSYRQPHRSLVAIHEDDTPNKRTSSSSQFPKDYPKPQTSGEARRPSATYHDSFQPRHDPYPLAQSPFDHSKIKSFRDGDRTFAPTLRRDSGLGPPAFATPLSARSSIDAFQESCHPYDVEHKARSKAKSDFVLHQQNYGPYLDASPQLASATLFTPTNTNTKLHEKNSTPSSSRYVDAPAPPSPVALALTSYDQRHLPSSSSSHTPSPHEYIPQPHRTFQGEAIHPDHGPMTPSSPTYCATERHSAPRIYGIDAADTPRPPSSYNAKSPYALQRAPDEFSSSDASRRHSMGQVGNNYHRPPSRDLRFLDYTSGRDFGPPRYEHPWASSMPHPPSYSPPSEPCIQPPSWYQSYAHAPKAHDDRTWFPEQEPRPPLTPRHSDHGHPYSGSWAPYAGPPHGYQEMELSEARCRDHDQSSRRPSRPSSHSVHPFDVTNPASPPSSSSTHRPQMSSPTNNKGNKRAQEDSDPFIVEDGIKAKRKRANASQLSVLNAAFEKSYFPSTEERLRLSKECKMCPRTVQIWFQNKRQSVKARPEALDAALMAGQNGSGRRSSMMDMRRASESGPGGPMRVREERQRAVTTATTTGLGIKRLLEEKEEERVKKEKEDVRETSHHHHHNNNDNNGNSHSQNSNGGPAAMDGDFSRKRRATIAKME
ncbi:hypothetical protein BG005_004579 [Podila minutissima]|nr:hypothetical protein BG005_004579 [Podila minutissima]